MFRKFFHFIKYNNATIIIAAIIFILGAGAFASETGREIVGQKQIRIEGTDNTLLLSIDLEAMDMDFKIESIKDGNDKYYVKYTYLDLVKLNNAWQYEIKEKAIKVSRKVKKDLGIYLAEELGEVYEARLKELKREQEKARETGEEKRFEVAEYSGLIGRTLNLISKAFPGYEPIKKEELSLYADLGELKHKISLGSGANTDGYDDLAEVYKKFVQTHPGQMSELDNANDNGQSTSTADADISGGLDLDHNATNTLSGAASSTDPLTGTSATSSINAFSNPSAGTSTEPTVASTALESEWNGKDELPQEVEIIELEAEK